MWDTTFLTLGEKIFFQRKGLLHVLSSPLHNEIFLYHVSFKLHNMHYFSNCISILMPWIILCYIYILRQRKIEIFFIRYTVIFFLIELREMGNRNLPSFITTYSSNWLSEKYRCLSVIILEYWGNKHLPLQQKYVNILKFQFT